MEKKCRRRVLGGHYLFAQTEPRRPASEVMRHHLDGQPAGSAFLGHPGESPRGRIHIMTLVRIRWGINMKIKEVIAVRLHAFSKKPAVE